MKFSGDGTHLIDQIIASPENVFTWANKPAASEYTGRAWFSDIGAMGYSDGVNWSTELGRPKIRKGNIGTRILSGRCGNFDNSTPKTFRAIIECAVKGVEAVRPVFVNGSSSVPYTVSGCNVRMLPGMPNIVNNITPTAVTLPSSGVVPVCGSVGTKQKNYLLGDWLYLGSAARTDIVGAGCLIVIDAYVSTAGTISIMGDGTQDIFTGWPSRATRKFKLLYNDGDCVTTPANFVSSTVRSQSPIVGVQYMARGNVITVMGSGDSITQGYGGTLTVEGFGNIACDLAQAATGTPFEWLNCGWGGSLMSESKLQLSELVAAGITPDICVFSTGSANNVGVPITASNINACRAGYTYVHRICKEAGVAPLVWNMPPYNSGSKNVDATDSLRVNYNAETLAYAGGAEVMLDFATALSGVTDSDGQINMLSGANYDGIHPNDTGYALMAAILAAKLKTV